MTHQKYDMGAFQLHTIKTDRYKTVTIRVSFKRPAKKEEVTIRNFLGDMLVRSSKEYATERLMVRRTEDLYDLNYRSTSSISGNYSVLSFDIRFLNEKYSEPGMIKESISFLMSLLFHPNVQDRAFDEKAFALEKMTLMNAITNLQDNTKVYAKTRLLEELDETISSSYRADGYLEDLEKITPTNLYEYYESVLHSDVVDVFVLGNIDMNEVKQIMMEQFPIKTLKRKGGTHYITHQKYRKRFKTVTEKKDVSQSNLVIGCKLTGLTDFELKYVSTVYSFILGGGPDSKLFQTVREKNSLCYTISSSVYKVYQLLLINSGIDRKDFAKAVKLIKKEMKNMTLGKFESTDIDKAKTTYISSCKEMLDSPDSALTNYVSMEYLDVDTLEERMKNIEKVTKEMVVNFAKKVHPDTIFLLEGVNNEEDTAH